MGQVFKFNIQYLPLYTKSILVIWKFAFPDVMMPHGFKAESKLGLTIHFTFGTVCQGISVSIWRCDLGR